MNILVVGGAGYIGSHTAHALRRHGFDVLIYDNLSTGHLKLAKGFEFLQGEIADIGRLARALYQADAVLHFAAHAYIGESVGDPRKYFRNNVESGLSLLNTCLSCGVRKLVFSSSCAVYGVPAKLPISEDAAREPVNPYGVSKLFFEHALEAYDNAYGLRYASLRYFNAAGADESGEIGELHTPETHLIPIALEAALGQRDSMPIYGNDYPTPDGTCIRDFVHVSDLAEAHVLALRHLLAEGESLAVNLGTGQGSLGTGSCSRCGIYYPGRTRHQLAAAARWRPGNTGGGPGARRTSLGMEGATLAGRHGEQRLDLGKNTAVRRAAVAGF
jgi:UDP-arabinose 4-epimerase